MDSGAFKSYIIVEVSVDLWTIIMKVVESFGRSRHKLLQIPHDTPKVVTHPGASRGTLAAKNIQMADPVCVVTAAPQNPHAPLRGDCSPRLASTGQVEPRSSSLGLNRALIATRDLAASPAGIVL